MIIFRQINKSINYKMQQIRYVCNTKSTNTCKPILYGDEISPPVRYVMMTAAVLGIDIDFHKIDLFKNENRTGFYKMINPLQKVPALQVGDIKILDSNAIALYLCQIAKNQCLYPENPDIRAKVNQILFFNSSTLFPIDSYILSQYFARQWPVNRTYVEDWYTALDYLEYLLDDNWLTGKRMLLCDIYVVAVVTSILPLVPLSKRHERVQRWIKNFEFLEFYDINKQGLLKLYDYIDLIKNTVNV